MIRRRGKGSVLVVSDQPAEFWPPARLPKSTSDRWQIETFFKALKQSLRVKTFVGTQRQCVEDADLGRPDCHAVDQVSAAEIHLRLVALQSGGIVAPAVVRIPRPVDLDRHLSTATPARSTAGTACFCSGIGRSRPQNWTAEAGTTSKKQRIQGIWRLNRDSTRDKQPILRWPTCPARRQKGGSYVLYFQGEPIPQLIWTAMRS